MKKLKVNFETTSEGYILTATFNGETVYERVGTRSGHAMKVWTGQNDPRVAEILDRLPVSDLTGLKPDSAF